MQQGQDVQPHSVHDALASFLLHFLFFLTFRHSSVKHVFFPGLDVG